MHLVRTPPAPHRPRVRINAPPGSARPSLARRAWRYQAERFPLAVYLPLIGISALGAAGFSRAARGETGAVPPLLLGPGVGTALVLFFVLRVLDEHKDAEVDRRFRPELPVPRGLVTLAELRLLGGAATLLVAVVHALLAPALLPALLAVAAWAALMTREFGVGPWLRAHPAAYLLSHMGVMPLIFVYLTGLDWIAAGAPPPLGLPAFLAAAFLNGCVVEIGRKVRAPEEERPGVDSYTAAWGRRAAPALWAGAMLAAAGCAALAATAAGIPPAVWLLFPLGAAAGVATAARFAAAPTPAGSAWISGASAAWTLACYALLGFGAALPRWIGALG
jgi:4-hydroxybenzoate polyprenyltransferase